MMGSLVFVERKYQHHFGEVSGRVYFAKSVNRLKRGLFISDVFLGAAKDVTDQNAFQKFGIRQFIVHYCQEGLAADGVYGIRHTGLHIRKRSFLRKGCGANQAGRNQGNSFHLKSFSVVKVVTAVMRRVFEMSSAAVSFKHLVGAAVAALSSYRWGRGGPVYVPPNLPVELGRVACAVRPTFLRGGCYV